LERQSASERLRAKGWQKLRTEFNTGSMTHECVRCVRFGQKVGDVGVTGQTSESTSDQHAERRTILPTRSAATSAVHIDGTEKGRERYRQRMSDGRRSTRQGTPQAALVVFDGWVVETQWSPNRTRRLADEVKARDAGATWASRPVVDGGEQRARSGARGCRMVGTGR
jgi:hypothetical protein